MNGLFTLKDEKFSLYSIAGLKRLGHSLLNEYASLGLSLGVSYIHLAKKTGRSFRKHHFGEMTERKEIIEALFALEEMIEKRKKYLEKKSKEVYAKT